MKNKFASILEVKSNTALTENGAESYRTTLDPVLDFFYLAPARQDQDNTDLFLNAFDADPLLAMKALFYIRDCRGGKGQRNTFNTAMRILAKDNKRLFGKVIAYCAEYGRWKDLIEFWWNSDVVKIVTRQLNSDIDNERPSLLAKWMPSENTSSKETVALAKHWIASLGMSSRSYRKMLSKLRSRIGITEKLMSRGQWEYINYSAVPSRAMKLYRKAFLKHDPERFTAFVEDAKTGKVSIKSSQVYPHEIVEKFLNHQGDGALEAQWNQLPNYFGDTERKVIPLIDVSSSMSDNNVLHIAIALGMYCAERNEGPFKDYFITFAAHPDFVKITGHNLGARINSISSAHWGGNTDIQLAFLQILRHAVQARVPKKDMPTNFIILSDMEFDAPYIGGKNFDAIQNQYKQAGYTMPVLTFWNLSARTNQVPVTKNTKNAFLVSGFSAETIGKVLNTETSTPQDLMLETLNSERYAFLNSLVK